MSEQKEGSQSENIPEGYVRIGNFTFPIGFDLEAFKKRVKENGLGRLVCIDGKWQAIDVPPDDEYIRSTYS